MDWDKLKVFTQQRRQGASRMPASSSAVAIGRIAPGQRVGAGALVSLFHRHARGLILTEQGDLLFRTAHDVFMQLQAARAKLTDSRERPSGDLKITTPPALGINWLIPRFTSSPRCIRRSGFP